ncbi:SIMPL domain-containing protein [Pelagerythrobacter marensis]|uniref:SIMPL domain-containing protein n=1 Tax=Pelagerythrobacter marensis TaxID=543877 RepID=A0ABZ2D0T8_9SPHN
MTDNSVSPSPTSTAFWREPQIRGWLASAAIVAAGLVAGGFLLGDGLVRAKHADRSVTVRGLAEREVTADLATWTISYSSTATDLASAQAGVDRDTASIEAFFEDLGFPAEALQPTGVNVNYYTDSEGVGRYTVRQRLSLRTEDIERAQTAARRQVELVRRGVVLEDGSAISYTFTELDAIKPEMVADATRDARAAAEQFAKDSGADVGTIRHATQGYFSIEARDGDAGGWGVSDTPYKKVRVVTTIDFSLD